MSLLRQRILDASDGKVVPITAAEPPVDEEAPAEGLALRVVLVADARVVEVANPAVEIERDEHVPVAEGEIARHALAVGLADAACQRR